MSAPVAVVATGYGGPEVLELRDVEVDAPGAGEVAVEVRAAGVNPVDHKLFSGAMGADPAQLPRRIGFEAAGAVTAVGEGAAGPRGSLVVGDEVILFRTAGAWASRVVVPGDVCVPKPEQVSWEAAAGLMLAGATAVHLLEATQAGPGDVVLLHGGAGGVGQAAIQLARARGVDRVIATASAHNHALVRELGGEAVAYGDGLEERVRELAGEAVTVAWDCVGTDEAVDTSLALVADRGRIATIAAFSRAADDGIRALGGGPGADPGTEVRDRARLELVDRVAAGELEVRTRAFPLAEAAEAVRVSQEGHVTGKLVLVP